MNIAKVESEYLARGVTDVGSQLMAALWIQQTKNKSVKENDREKGIKWAMNRLDF